MPRDGSGVYSKPAGTTASPNTTIKSSKYNSQVDDMVSDANTARPVTAGGTGRTTARLLDGTWRFENTADPTKLLALDLSGLTTATTRTWTAPDYNGTLSLQAKGTDIATASTVNLDTATGEFVDLTGTTTVTAVTLGLGKARKARVVSGFILTASASFVVNGSTSGNYTARAGSLLYFEGYASSVVYVWVIGDGPTTGVNGNGRWTKYPDGTQECWETITTSGLAITAAFFGGFRSSGQTWLFPAGFAAGTQPTVVGSVGAGTAFGVVIMDQTADPTASLVYSFTTVSSTAATDPRIVEFHAKGRWY